MRETFEQIEVAMLPLMIEKRLSGYGVFICIGGLI